VITHTCQTIPYGSAYSMMGVGAPYADSGWVAAGSLISIPIPANTPSSQMGYCYSLAISARSSPSNYFDVLGGQGVRTTNVEITPISAVRPRVDLAFKKGGFPINPTVFALGYNDPLEISLTGADPYPSEVLQYKISIRDICTTYSVLYTSSWSTQSEFSFAAGSIFSPASVQSTMPYGPYFNRCVEVTAYVRDNDGTEYYGLNQGDASLLSTVAYSDGRLPIVTDGNPQILFNGSTAAPTNLNSNTPFSTSILGYRDAEGRPLRVRSEAIELCNGNVVSTHYLGPSPASNPLSPVADNFYILNQTTLQMALPTPSACVGSRQVHFIQTIQDENPTADTSSNHTIVVLDFNADWSTNPLP
jgi:hypothetical protein